MAITAIIDQITLFGSGAIVSYLISTYDKTESITYTSFPETFHLQQESYCQSFRSRTVLWPGSLVPINRFNHFHPEPLPSARDRYNNEINRVAGVLDTHLANRSWLVGEKCTYADLSFVMWNAQIPFILKDAKDGWDVAKYPHFTRWQESMMARNSLKYVMSVLMKKEAKSEGRA